MEEKNGKQIRKKIVRYKIDCFILYGDFIIDYAVGKFCVKCTTTKEGRKLWPKFFSARLQASRNKLKCYRVSFLQSNLSIYGNLSTSIKK